MIDYVLIGYVAGDRVVVEDHRGRWEGTVTGRVVGELVTLYVVWPECWGEVDFGEDDLNGRPVELHHIVGRAA